MKFLLGGSAIIFLIVLSVLQVGVSSCTKDHNIYDTVTVIKKDTVTVIRGDTVTVKDTVTIKDTVLTAEILASHPWKVKELRAVNEGTIEYYLRGGFSNTISFDNEYTVFNADKTGNTVDNAGYSHTIFSWDLTTTDKTTLTFTIENITGITTAVTWDNIRYKDKNIYYDDYYTDSYTGWDYHGQEIRIPK